MALNIEELYELRATLYPGGLMNAVLVRYGSGDVDYRAAIQDEEFVYSVLKAIGVESYDELQRYMRTESKVVFGDPLVFGHEVSRIVLIPMGDQIRIYMRRTLFQPIGEVLRRRKIDPEVGSFLERLLQIAVTETSPIPHIIFVGPTGSGKTLMQVSLLRIVAHTLPIVVVDVYPELILLAPRLREAINAGTAYYFLCVPIGLHYYENLDLEVAKRINNADLIARTAGVKMVVFQETGTLGGPQTYENVRNLFTAAIPVCLTSHVPVNDDRLAVEVLRQRFRVPWGGSIIVGPTSVFWVGMGNDVVRILDMFTKKIDCTPSLPEQIYNFLMTYTL